MIDCGIKAVACTELLFNFVVDAGVFDHHRLELEDSGFVLVALLMLLLGNLVQAFGGLCLRLFELFERLLWAELLM